MWSVEISYREGETPILKQYGFDANSIPFGMDLDTLKNVALPATGDIVATENGQDKVITGLADTNLYKHSLFCWKFPLLTKLIINSTKSSEKHH